MLPLMLHWVHLAACPRVAVGAEAAVGAHAIHADTPVKTGPGLALVHLVLAVGACEAGPAPAGEGVHPIYACTPIEAGTVGREEGWAMSQGGCALWHPPPDPVCCLLAQFSHDLLPSA